MLQVVDNGHGMDHDEIVRMLSIGHESPDEDDRNQIGRFGVGFKVFQQTIILPFMKIITLWLHFLGPLKNARNAVRFLHLYILGYKSLLELMESVGNARLSL